MSLILLLVGVLCSVLNGSLVFLAIKYYGREQKPTLLYIISFVSYGLLSTKFFDYSFFKHEVFDLSVWYIVLILFFFLTTVSLLFFQLSEDKQAHEIYAKNLGIAKQYAEIELLKLELDPHFLFNSLNTLSHLIPKHEANARGYVQMLAEVYRYILQNKNVDMVALKYELSFCRIYFALLRIRFGGNVSLHIEIENIEAELLLIPPIALQILIENAIKHNHFDEDNPLRVNILVSGSQVVVENNLNNSGPVIAESLQIGLKNLESRFSILCHKAIKIETTEHVFRIILPLISPK